MVTAAMKLKKRLLLGRKLITNLDSILKSRDLICKQISSSQSYGFSSSHVWMWDFEHKESWTPKNRCFWSVVFRVALESSLDSEAIQPVNPQGNQSWIFIGKIDAEAETPVLWPPDGKNWLLKKTLMLGKIECCRRRGLTEDELVGWHPVLNGHEFL